jgi:acyl-coenzyme A synthetase/AMP-(fatty) acid ligase
VLDAVPGISVINGYGPTENTTFTCCHVMTVDNRPVETVPIGRPIGGTQVQILDSDLQPVADGCEGELFAGGRGVALGYLDAPEATRAAFLPDPSGHGLLYRTGDIVRRRGDGPIEFLGRRDRLTKIRGYRVSVDEVQAVIARLPGVEECVVKVREDAAGEKYLAAVIQARDEPPDMPAFVRTELRKQVPPYMIPDTITVCAQLPLNANGKVDPNRIPGNEPSFGENHG